MHAYVEIVRTLGVVVVDNSFEVLGLGGGDVAYFRGGLLRGNRLALLYE